MHLAPYKNLIFVLFGRLFDYAITLALLSGLAHLAGGEIFGAYYFARSVATLTASLAELGLSRFTIKLLAERPRQYTSLFGNLLVLRILISTLALLLLFGVLLNIGVAPEVVEASLVFALGLALFQVADLYLDVLRACETMLMPVLLNVLQRTVYVGFALLGLSLGYRLAWVLTAFVIANLLHLVVSAALIRLKFGQTAIGSKRISSKLFSDAGPFTAIVLLGAISGKVGVLLLYYFRDDTSVGLYGAAIHIIEALFYIAFAITSVAFPNLVRLHSSGRPEFFEGARTVAKFLLLFIAPVACLLLIIAEPLITLIYGAAYIASAQILQIAICAAVPGFLNAFLLIMLQAMGHQRLAAILMIPFILVQVITALYFIPSHGGTGAAIAFAIAEVSHFLTLSFVISRFVSLRELSRGLWKILLAVTLMAFVCSMPTPLDRIPQVIAGTFFFIALIVYLKPFTPGELRWVLTSLSRDTEQK